MQLNFDELPDEVAAAFCAERRDAERHHRGERGHPVGATVWGIAIENAAGPEGNRRPRRSLAANATGSAASGLRPAGTQRTSSRCTSKYVHVQCGVATTMTVSEARAALPQILDRVLAGEEVTLTRHGEPVAVVVRPDALRVRRADEALAAAGRLRDALDRGRRTSLRRRPTLPEDRAEELVADVRAGRATR